MTQYLKTSNNLLTDAWEDGTFCPHNQWTHECRACTPHPPSPSVQDEDCEPINDTYTHCHGRIMRGDTHVATVIADPVNGLPSLQYTSSTLYDRTLLRLCHAARVGLFAALTLALVTTAHAAPIPASPPASCAIIGTVPSDEGFPLAFCDNGTYLYFDADGDGFGGGYIWRDASGYMNLGR